MNGGTTLSADHGMSGLGDLLDECGIHTGRTEVNRIIAAVWPELRAFVLHGRPMTAGTLPAIAAAADAAVAAGLPVAALVRLTHRFATLAAQELSRADVDAVCRALVITHDVTAAVLRAEDRRQAAPRPRIDLLERELLVLTARGLSTAEMADATFYSRQAVSYHLGRLMARFGMPNRTALVAFAYEHGLLAPIPATATGTA